MAVKIDIDLNAGEATGKIGAIAASLKGLERVAGDIDIDFDGDIADITGEIDKFAEALEGLDINTDGLLDDFHDAINEIEDTDIDVNVNGPSSSDARGGGASGGNPPPGLIHDLTEFGSDVDTSSTSGDRDAPSILDRIYGGKQVTASEDFLGEMFKLRNSKTSNLGASAPGFSVPQHDGSRVGVSGRFGMEPVSMSLRRKQSNIPEDEFTERAARPNAFVKRMGRSLAEAQAAAFKDADVITDFRDFNTNIRSGVPETDAEIGAASSGSSGDFGSIFGGSGGRSKRDIIEGNSVLSRIDRMTDLSSVMEEVSGATDSLGSSFRRFRPTMGKYMQLLAALIPIAIGLGTQLLGVAAAMGSVAVAGGALIGLGMIGHADSLTGSIAEAKQELQQFKLELFEEISPTAQTFAPIQSRAFDAIPAAVGDIADQAEGLTAFEETIFNMGGDLAGGIEEAISLMIEYESTISSVSQNFSGLIGGGLLKFFEFLLNTISQNQALLVNVGRQMVKLAVVAFNLAMAITRIVGALGPMFNILVFISELLNSQLIVNLLTMIAYLFILGKAAGLVYALASGFMTLTVGVADAALAMFGYEMSTWGAVAATMALVGAIGLLTLGAATVIGGAVTGSVMQQQPGADFSGGGAGPGSGTTTVYNDNRSYQINSGGGDDYASQKRMEGVVKKVNETTAATNPPE